MKGIITILILISFCHISHFATAQKSLSLDDFFVNGTFRTKGVQGFRSMNDGEHYTVIEEQGKKLVKYSYKTGKAVETLLDVDKLEGGKIKSISEYHFSPNENHILLATNRKQIYRHTYTADYYIYEFKNRDLKPLSEEGGQQVPLFSPDGLRIAFARENNLFIHDLRFGSEIQITNDGKFNHIINGVPDWVYEEEFGFNRAFEWAADGSALAYIKFNETDVREFHMSMYEGQRPAIKENELYPSVYTYKYPKAGEKNSTVSVHVYDIKDRTTLLMNIGEETDIYIPRIRWTNDPKKLAIIRLNRFQNRMEILLANARTGEHAVLYREENKYYIDQSNYDNLKFIGTNEFIITSEKSGYMHIYLYDMTGQQKRAITSGNYDIANFYGYDATRKMYYYSSFEESPLEKYVYSVDAKGKKLKLTPETGWNDVSFSKNYNYYLNTVSSMEMPPVTKLYNAKSAVLRTLEDNSQLKTTLQEYAISKKEFIQIPSADNNYMLNAWVMKPLDYTEGKKYPILITQYSGPNSQQVKNSWGGVNWLHYLAQEGYVVVSVDPRGTAARGEEFRKCTYMQLGKLESDDLIAAAKWLAQQPYSDGKNFGIWGWSYGGFMSSLCLMKGNDIFTTAIAVAPVTHFKYYDTIYTERYMRTPQENEKGYNENAPLTWADKLKGNLLLCHGTADDNVHVQNTYELAERLVQANKQFDMAIYTNRNHSIYGGNTTMQLYNKFISYLNLHLKK